MHDPKINAEVNPMGPPPARFMTTLNLFDRINHLMIEVNDPQAVCEEFHWIFALPQLGLLSNCET